MARRLEVRHITGSHKDEEGFTILHWSTYLVGVSYTRQYHESLPLLMRLSPCARNLLDYLTTVMDSGNIVQNNASRRRSFMSFMASCGIVYGDATVQNAFMELSDTGLLLHFGRGAYQLNPEYVMRGAATKRSKLIRANLERYDKQEGEQS